MLNLRSKIKITNRRSKRLCQWSIIGIVGVLILTSVFVVGVEFGRGNWTFGLEQSAISANQSLPNQLNYTSINQVYQALKQKYDGQLSINNLMNGLKSGLVNAVGDPYTTYFDASQAKTFDEQLNGSFSGIGAELGKSANNIVIIAPIAGYPAAQAGLKAGDVITAVNGQTTTNWSVDQAVSAIRGDQGTTVKLTVLRNNQQTINFSIVRAVITVPSVTSKIVSDNIGYIQISQFADDTAGLVNSAAANFKAKNVKGIILDLRNDPGGYLEAAVSVSSQWLKNGQLIVQEKRGNQLIQSYSAQGDGQLVGIPTVVLVNSGSASASEITAGALNGAATIMGVTSFGKGSVQEIVNLSGGDMLKVTVARWYRPDGQNIDKQGIKPDIKVVLTDAEAAAGNDTQLQAAETLLQH
jgi:carboxyl-terminal processing protease